MKLKKTISYLLLYFIWGTTYYYIKVAVSTTPALYVSSIRLICGGFLLLIFLVLSNKFKTATKKEILNAAIVGCFLLIGGMSMITIAEEKVDSYLTALLVSCIPFAVVISDNIICKIKTTKTSILAIAIGFSGVILLLQKNTGEPSSFTPHTLLIISGVTLWSIGTSLSKKLELPQDSSIRTLIQMLAAGTITFAVLQFFHPVTNVNWSIITIESLIAIIYLTLSSVITLIALSFLLKTEPNSRVVSYTFVNPLIAIFFGISVGGEQPVKYLSQGSALILMALIIMFYGKNIVKTIKNIYSKKVKNTLL